MSTFIDQVHHLFRIDPHMKKQADGEAPLKSGTLPKQNASPTSSHHRQHSDNDTWEPRAASTAGTNGSRESCDSYKRLNVRVHEKLMKRKEQDAGNDTHGFADFFSRDVFQLVLDDPSTAHRFSKFCQNSACEENMGFLEKINTYRSLLDNAAELLEEIQATYISNDSSDQVNLPQALMKRVTVDIGTATQATIPAMGKIFLEAQEHVEDLLRNDIYPRFVQHQMAMASTITIADNDSGYAGLGDSFCLTDPNIADDPITFASDGFVEVTGYSRHDIIPRNCRFLQGSMTDKASVQRIRTAVDNRSESVELILNYRKNGEPFWNLLYVTPLFDEQGKLAFYLGAQINCSTTIHSHADIMKILSLNTDAFDKDVALDPASPNKSKPSLLRKSSSRPSIHSKKSTFFKSWRKHDSTDAASIISVRSEVGIEAGLIEKIRNMNFDTQMKTFYSAYSKYWVLRYIPHSGDLIPVYYSEEALDMLGHNNPSFVAYLRTTDIFKAMTFVSPHDASGSLKETKMMVKEHIKAGKAVSFDVAAITAPDGKVGLSSRAIDKETGIEKLYSSHWTPVKDLESKVGWVVWHMIPK